MFMLGSTRVTVVVLISVQEETVRNLRQPFGRKREIVEMTRISNPISCLQFSRRPPNSVPERTPLVCRHSDRGGVLMGRQGGKWERERRFRPTYVVATKAVSLCKKCTDEQNSVFCTKVVCNGTLFANNFL